MNVVRYNSSSIMKIFCEPSKKVFVFTSLGSGARINNLTYHSSGQGHKKVNILKLLKYCTPIFVHDSARAHISLIKDLMFLL